MLEASIADYERCDPTSQFTCRDTGKFNASLCIPLSARCDGWSDCPDASDEDKYNCPVAPVSTCADGKWQCPNGPCISEDLLCDGVVHCEDAADEISCGKAMRPNDYQCPLLPSIIEQTFHY